MAEIYLSQSKEFNNNTSVLHNRLLLCQNQINFLVMLCVHLLLSDERKQDSDTTDAHSKTIELLKNRQHIFYDLSTIWDNNNGCDEQYICASALYLLSILAHAYNIIIDKCIRTPGHGR